MWMGREFIDHWWLQGGRALIVTMGMMVTWWSRMDMIRDRMSMSLSEINDIGGVTYDFIVVGAGSAGNVVANRLSEHFSVLLLEAGGEPFPASDIPTFTLGLLNRPEIDWMHETVVQKNSCLALIDQVSGWSQGKVLGGSSSTNFLIYIRGHPMDFDNWAKVTGDKRWNYEGVLPYFKKIEDYNAQEWQGSKEHGKGGPLRIEAIPDKTVNADPFIKAAIEMGYKHVDINGNFTEGFDSLTFPLKKGVRQSTYNAYIKPLRKRKTLTVKKYAHVTKILFRENEHGQNVEAFGVEYFRHGRKFEAFSRKEVIISAGLQSPKILMLSGIGPKSHLEEVGIEVKVDSPMVGENLQDHISIYLPFMVNKGASVMVERDVTVEALKQYFNKGTGTFSQSGAQAVGFLTSSYEKAESSQSHGVWPDIQLIYTGVHLYSDDGQDFARAFHVQPAIIKEYADRLSNYGKNHSESFTIIVSLGRPKQRGYIKLKSKDPLAPLIIDPKYFQDHETDIKILVEGVKKAVEMAETTKAFKKLGARFPDQPFPGCEGMEIRSEVYYECFIRQYTITLHHIVGASAMGPHNVSEAVVDSELRVNGVKNLRVIDASVMPTVPIGNTNAPTIMIGERGAQFILDRWLKLHNFKKS